MEIINDDTQYFVTEKLIEEMEKLGVKEGDIVRLSEMEFEFVL